MTGAADLSVPRTVLAAQVEIGSLALEDALRRAWGDEVLRPAADYRLTLGAQWTQAPVTGPLRAVSTSQGPVMVRGGGDTWALEGGGVVFHVGDQDAQVCLPARFTPLDHLAGHLALVEVGRASGLIPLHAAVLGRGDRAVAVSGVSGAGKSTAALRLLQRGWSLVAEDSAWLDPLTLRVAGADQGLRVHDASVQRFAPDWLDRPVTRDVHGKRQFDVPRVRGATLERLYLLGEGRGLLPPARAVQALWAASGLPLGRAAQQTVSGNLARLARTLPLEDIGRDELVRVLA